MAARVLIVEDEMLIAFHLECLVEEAGHCVIGIARDPAEAAKIAAAERPDFAMLDIRLAGGTSGLDAARDLHEKYGIRAIFLSGNLDPETRRAAARYAPLGFIGKPFLSAEVIGNVRRAAQHCVVG
jgi:DNA-binding NarL/FixJ family response regulator